jgi:WD40 repeat protein
MMGNAMKDERAHLQLFDLIAREWALTSPATGITFNANNTAVAFSSADGTVHLAPTADKDSPNSRVRRAVDTARLTIAPRAKPALPLKPADFAQGRTSPVVVHGADGFAFAKDTGRINTLTPGGIAVHLPIKAPAPITLLACHGDTIAYACGEQLMLGTHPLATLPDITAMAFSPDGQTLAVAHPQGITRLQVAAPHAAIHTPLDATPAAIIWLDDGTAIALPLQTGGFVVIDSHTVTHHGNFPAPVRHVAFATPTNTVVASGAFRVAAWSMADNSDVISGKPGLVLIDAIATCPTRNLVAVGYANGLLSLAEIGRPSEILLREDTGAGFTAMAWSSCGNHLAIAGSDGSAALVAFPDSMFKS